MINFNNDTIPYSGRFYLIHSLPVGANLDSNIKFPVYVNITYKYNGQQCTADSMIDILTLIRK